MRRRNVHRPVDPKLLFQAGGVSASGGASFGVGIGGDGGRSFAPAKGSKVIHGTLRVGGRLEDEARIALQNFQPVGDVGRVLLARLGRQFQMGTLERRAQLGNEFFLCVTFIAPLLALEITGEAGRVLGSVRHLVRESGLIALGIAEALERWHLNVIDFLRVVGAIAATADRSSAGGEEVLGALDARHRIVSGQVMTESSMRIGEYVVSNGLTGTGSVDKSCVLVDQAWSGRFEANCGAHVSALGDFNQWHYQPPCC